MDLDRFQEEAHHLVDWLTEYHRTIEARPVRAQTAPGTIAGQLPSHPPAGPEPFAAILEDLERIVMPGITHWQHPRFFAYFPANASPPSVLAEILTAGIAAQCMLWQTSPAATEMETRILDWLAQMLGLGPNADAKRWHGVIQDSASSATLVAILVARERATGWRADAEGLHGCPPLAVYTSEEAHSSVEKAVRIAGLGRKALRLVPTDHTFAMRPEALDELIRADLAAGIKPACVIATLGTTGTGGVDPLAAIGAIAKQHDIYLHIDAAWAGSALVLPETRWMIEGIEAADSFVTNPHKWLGVNFDCSAHYVRDPDELIRTLTVNPAYLTGQETGRVIDYRDWGIPLGRRFRALKLWFVLRSYGVEGLQAMLRRHIDLAAELASWIEADPAFELTSKPSLALLSFRYRPKGRDEPTLDALNARLVERINDDGRIYLTQTRVRGQVAIRFSIGQTTTERRHVEEGWAVVREVAGNL
jgi:aromatic-L-amino-acid/L-tryptophan decarboxylase